MTETEDSWPTCKKISFQGFVSFQGFGDIFNVYIVDQDVYTVAGKIRQ